MRFAGGMSIKTLKLGQSKNGQSIEVLSRSGDPRDCRILVLSGLHGDETEGVILNTLILNEIFYNHTHLLPKLAFLPIANPDGFSLSQRWNANNVDLNRNWPTKDWTAEYSNPRYPPGPAAESEVETKYLRQFIEGSKIDFVLDLHSYLDTVLLPLFHKAGETQEHKKIHESLLELSTGVGLRIDHDPEGLGYKITGGFHTWCFENEIHTLTVEIEKGLGQHAIKGKFVDPLIRFLANLI